MSEPEPVQASDAMQTAMSRQGVSQLKTNESSWQEFVEKFQRDNRRKNPEIFPQGQRPSDVWHSQPDFSVTTKSSRVDDRSYGMDDNLQRSKPSGALSMDQSQGVMKIGAIFASDPAPREADIETDDQDSSSSSSQTCLSSRLSVAMEVSKDGRDLEWLPVGELYKICDLHSVEYELRKHRISSLQSNELARKVCGNSDLPDTDADLCRRIFAILVLIERVEMLPTFVEAGIRDRHLPFLWVSSSGRTLLHSESSMCPFGTESLPAKLFRGNLTTTRNFYRVQWQTLAPVISQSKKDGAKLYHLNKDVILPWLWIGPDVGGGGYGIVQGVEIHPDHHSFDTHKRFAIKTLREPNADTAAEEFKQELKAFNRMTPGDHLLNLLASFKIGEQYSFLFPWADGGNLAMVMEQSPKSFRGKPVSPHQLLRWIAEQCHGLTKALQSIHDRQVKMLIQKKKLDPDDAADEELYGIHGDIKPDNILHFEQPENPTGLGVLKISDFGLTEFHKSNSRTQTIHHGIGGRGTLTWSAPEAYISRKMDVWSLGCVFSHLLTWVIRGADGVAKYSNARLNEKDTASVSKIKYDRFWVIESLENGTVEILLKKSVTKWLEGINQDVATDNGPNFLTDFCDLIRKKMLLCDRIERISCKDLVEELAKFASRAGEIVPNDPYWSPALPSFDESAVSTPIVSFSKDPPNILNGV